MVTTGERDDDPLKTGDARRREVEGTPDNPTLRLLAEDVRVAKERLETGRLRVSTRTHECEALIDEDLLCAKLAAAHDEVLRLAEEQLNVGKQMVETGRTRVRRFVTERPVSADVTLHEEHAELLRRAVTDPKFVGDIDWADQEIEVIETAEHALVNKTARVVEEVSLKKIGTDHVETVHDKIRRQQVEIERVGPGGKILPTARA